MLGTAKHGLLQSTPPPRLRTRAVSTWQHDGDWTRGLMNPSPNPWYPEPLVTRAGNAGVLWWYICTGWCSCKAAPAPNPRPSIRAQEGTATNQADQAEISHKDACYCGNLLGAPRLCPGKSSRRCHGSLPAAAQTLRPLGAAAEARRSTADSQSLAHVARQVLTGEGEQLVRSQSRPKPPSGITAGRLQAPPRAGATEKSTASLQLRFLFCSVDLSNKGRS